MSSLRLPCRPWRPRRLYQKIYIAILIASAIVFFTVALTVRVFVNPDRHEDAFRTFAEMMAPTLPRADAPPARQAQAIAGWSRRAGVRIALYDAGRHLIASAGGEPALPPPAMAQSGSGWTDSGPGTPYALRLSDGRWLLLMIVSHDLPFPLGLMGVLALLAIAIGVGALPVVRRITRRLDDLRRGVEALGGGDLAARVALSGEDEVDSLALSFNRSAERIESLVRAQNRLLANASHELRSPLARIQMALGLLPQQQNTDVWAEIRTNLAELDQLIEEILLASRLEAGGHGPVGHVERVDFTALVAEECARADADLTGTLVEVDGDARLLRRLIRNLLENARRYGAGSVIEVVLSADDGLRAVLEIRDRGPGVPPAERERIFEPFYRLAGSSERAGGVGLGLSLVRTIARQHAGQVVCLARTGGGSRFVFSMPLPLRSPS